MVIWTYHYDVDKTFQIIDTSTLHRRLFVTSKRPKPDVITTCQQRRIVCWVSCFAMCFCGYPTVIILPAEIGICNSGPSWNQRKSPYPLNFSFSRAVWSLMGVLQVWGWQCADCSEIQDLLWPYMVAHVSQITLLVLRLVFWWYGVILGSEWFP